MTGLKPSLAIFQQKNKNTNIAEIFITTVYFRLLGKTIRLIFDEIFFFDFPEDN